MGHGNSHVRLHHVWNVFFESLGHYTDARRATGRRPLDQCAEWRRQSGWCHCAVAHWVCSRPDREFFRGFCRNGSCRPDRRAGRSVHHRADSGSAVGQERTLRLSCPILLAILLPTGLAASEAELKSQIASVASEVRPDEAMEHMRRIYSTDRFFTFPKFQQTAEYLKQAMTAAGLKNVEIVGAPADGTSQFGFWTMPMAWDARSARLELLEPGTPPEFRVLADYQQVPASLGMWSARTLPQGVTTELI